MSESSYDGMAAVATTSTRRTLGQRREQGNSREVPGAGKEVEDVQDDSGSPKLVLSEYSPMKPAEGSARKLSVLTIQQSLRTSK